MLLYHGLATLLHRLNLERQLPSARLHTWDMDMGMDMGMDMDMDTDMGHGTWNMEHGVAASSNAGRHRLGIQAVAALTALQLSSVATPLATNGLTHVPTYSLTKH
jgi:hypothetical protein